MEKRHAGPRISSTNGSRAGGVRTRNSSHKLNLWDLICLDKEFSDIGLYEYYDEMITNIVEGYVGELPSAEKVALWLQTDEAMEWLYPEDGQESSEKPDPDPTAIARYIKDEFVYPEVSANPSRRAELVYERDISPGQYEQDFSYFD